MGGARTRTARLAPNLSGRHGHWSGYAIALLVPIIVAGGLVARPLHDAGLLWPALGLAVLGGLLACRTALRSNALRVPAAMLVFWLVLLAWFPLALSRTPDRFAGDREVTYLAQAALWTIPALLLTRGRAGGVRAQRRGWILALVLCCAIATWEITTGQHLWIAAQNPWPFGDAPRAAGTFINPNNLAAALVAMIAAATAALATLTGPVALHPPGIEEDGLDDGLDGGAFEDAFEAGRRTSRRLWLRIEQLVLAVLIAYGSVIIVLSGSRAALAALVGVVVLQGWRILRERAGGRGVLALLRRHLGVVVGLAVAGVAAFLGLLFAPERLIARNPLRRIVFGHLDPATAASDDLRAGLVRAALRYLRDSDYLGSGAGSFEALLAADPNPGVIARTNLHQAFVELVSQYGVVVGAAFAVAVLVLIGALLGSAVRDRRRTAGAARERRIARHEAYGYLLSYGAFGASASSALSYPAWWLTLTAAAAIAWWLAGSRIRRQGYSASRRSVSPSSM
ncbi:MAG: O-antigen ligase family protein [Micrococcales bacterium]|nr:O-antigen ligase family protein [Micrococcales bacterium]